MNVIEAFDNPAYRDALRRLAAQTDHRITAINAVLCEDQVSIMLYGYCDDEPDLCVTACFEPSPARSSFH